MNRWPPHRGTDRAAASEEVEEERRRKKMRRRGRGRWWNRYRSSGVRYLGGDSKKGQRVETSQGKGTVRYSMYGGLNHWRMLVGRVYVMRVKHKTAWWNVGGNCVLGTAHRKKSARGVGQLQCVDDEAGMHRDGTFIWLGYEGLSEMRLYDLLA